MQEILEILTLANFDDEFIDYIEKSLVLEDWEGYRPFVKDGQDPIYELDEHNRALGAVYGLLDLKKKYQKRNIPLNYLYQSIDNLNFRVVRYQNNYGEFGLTDSDCRWLSYIYYLELFDIGTMRFQRFWFSYEEIERSGNDSLYLPLKYKKQFPEGTPIINIHIHAGADISDSAVEASFQEAVQFFENYFLEHRYKAFVGRTWMFYPETLSMLNPASNIVKLAERFEIIAQSNNRWQGLQRIYGTTDLDEIKKMPKASSLARSAYKNIEKLGVGVGIIHKEDI